MISLTKDHKMLGYASLDACPNISHFVTTRYGGCSSGAYGTFNCSPYCGDEFEDVCRNQALLLDALPYRPTALIIPKQTHQTNYLVVNEEFLTSPVDSQQTFLEGVDALMTDKSGYCLGVSTADCVPIMLYDSTHQAVAVVHAGWRGTVGRILEQTLQGMFTHYGTTGKDIQATIGPSISSAAFEVGEEVCEAFQKGGYDLDEICMRHPQTGKAHIDLWAANFSQLRAFGVSEAQVEFSGICTYTAHEQFFSARRLGVKSGRILSGLMLNPIPLFNH